MDELQKAREQINEIDEQMAELFQKRMQAVENVIGCFPGRGSHRPKYSEIKR